MLRYLVPDTGRAASRSSDPDASAVGMIAA
jgi:hypothetical protein